MNIKDLIGGGYREINSAIVDTGLISDGATVNFPLGFTPKNIDNLRVTVYVASSYQPTINISSTAYAYEFTPFTFNLCKTISIFRVDRGTQYVTIGAEYDQATNSINISAGTYGLYLRYRVFEIA